MEPRNDTPSSKSRAARLSNAASISLIILAVIAVLGVAYLARPILFPITLASLLAFALQPVARFLSKQAKAPPPVAAAALVATLLITLIGGIYLLSAPASKWIGNAPRQFEEIEHKVRPVKESVEDISEAAEKLDKMAEGVKSEDKVKVEVARPTLTATALSVTSEVLLELGIAISCLFILLAWGDQFLRRVSRASGPFSKDHDLVEVFGRIEAMVSHYLFTFSLINAGLGLVIGIGMWIIGMPNPILWGVMAACLNFIPYLGLAAGCSIVLFVALVSFDSAFYAALAPLIYFAVNMLEANVVTPALLGKAMSINVIVLFIGILLWGWLWGIGGVLIAVPMLGALKVICDQFDELSPISILLSGGESYREDSS